jgi:plastocyanin
MPLALTAGLATFAVAVPAALAASATIAWDNGSDTTTSINQGESVTWDVQGGGHNVDVYSGPETFKSTSGKDPVGTQFSHVFNKPGTYKFICDYHSSMKGTITVAAAQAQPAPGPSPAPGTSPQPAPGGSTQQPTTGAAAGPAGESAAASGVDAAAPTVQRVSLSRTALRVRLSEPAKLTIRYRKVGAKKVGKKVVSGRKGTNVIKLAKLMRNGRYHVSVVATDAAGNVSKALRVQVRR